MKTNLPSPIHFMYSYCMDFVAQGNVVVNRVETKPYEHLPQTKQNLKNPELFFLVCNSSSKMSK